MVIILVAIYFTLYLQQLITKICLLFSEFDDFNRQQSQKIIIFKDPNLMSSNGFAGSLNTKGFSSRISSYQIPPEEHFTYEGYFNEIKFSVGPRTKQVLDFHSGFARYQNINSLYNNKMEQYLALFMKGNSDGQPRDDRVLNSVIVLDISGSMGGRLSNKPSQDHKSRLDLSKEAIKMFVSKLRADDSFGLILFNNRAQTFLPVTKKQQINMEKFFQQLALIKANGGTTLIQGFNESVSQLKEYLKSSKSKEQQNRIIMLTDVMDNSVANEEKLIIQIAEEGINMTLIGISDEFRSETCEKLKTVKGFNYFCATQDEDLKKHLFQNFDFTFFPSCYDMEIQIKSQKLDRNKIKVYGTPDSELIQMYNVNLPSNKFVVSRMTTAFPSQLHLEDDTVLTYGGLILIRLGQNNVIDNHFKADIQVKYKNTKGEKCLLKREVDYACPDHQQFFSDESLKEALDSYAFVSQLKALLKQLKAYETQQNNSMSNIQTVKKQPKQLKKWEQILNQLQKTCPKSKIEDIKSIRKILDRMMKQKTD